MKTIKKTIRKYKSECPICKGLCVIEITEEIEELEKFDLKVDPTVTSVSSGNHFDDCKAKIPKPFNDGLYQV